MTDTDGMKIRDYAFLSDCQSAALVGCDGSIDWFCLPRFDSSSVFARMLGPGAGHWRLSPAGRFKVKRDYVKESLVLRSVFTTAEASVEAIDALALEPGSRGHEIGLNVPHTILRLVRGFEGTAEMMMELSPRLEYGQVVPTFSPIDGGLVISGGDMILTLLTSSGVELQLNNDNIMAVFRISPDEAASFSLTFGSSPAELPEPLLDTEKAIRETITSWQSLGSMHEAYQGLYMDQVRRSAIVLQGLTYQPTGAVVAAATTSLPEAVGGGANWDYRFSWLRDASMMMRALWVAACPDEPERFFEWINKASVVNGREAFQIMYGVNGERNLTEHILQHLEGFSGSRPVRIGNDAWKQKQLDVLGEVLDAAYVLRERLGVLSRSVRELLVGFADQAAARWREPDSGIWEARCRERHYTVSKVMCWVALDRAIKLSGMLQTEGKEEKWKVARRQVRQAILARSWDPEVGAFTGAFDSNHLDAAVLLIPLVEFLPATDKRMRSTIEAIDSRFCREGLVRRWQEERSGFIICSYWLVECLALAGRKERAQEIFEQVTALANDVGLLSEMADMKTGELLGNFPQAFSHVGLINAAWRLTLAYERAETADFHPH